MDLILIRLFCLIFFKNGTFSISKIRCNRLFTYQNNDELAQKVGFTIGDSVSKEFKTIYPPKTVLDGKVIAMSRRKRYLDFEGEKLLYKYNQPYKMKN